MVAQRRDVRRDGLCHTVFLRGVGDSGGRGKQSLKDMEEAGKFRILVPPESLASLTCNLLDTVSCVMKHETRIASTKNV